MTSVHDLAALLDATLDITSFDDYAPNGLQVTASDQLERIAFGVSANAALIDAAADVGADALVVHHGFFWRGEDRTLTGIRAQRVRSLFDNNLSLLAYHLPLDAHATLGNAAGILDVLDVPTSAPFHSSGRIGTLDAPMARDRAVAILRGDVAAPTAAFLHGPTQIRTVAVVTGGGPGYFEAAVAAGADLFITGEASEQSQGLARELEANFVACGHHATETFGPRALRDHVAQHTDTTCTFIDIPNPV